MTNANVTLATTAPFDLPDPAPDSSPESSHLDSSNLDQSASFLDHKAGSRLSVCDTVDPNTVVVDLAWCYDGDLRNRRADIVLRFLQPGSAASSRASSPGKVSSSTPKRKGASVVRSPELAMPRMDFGAAANNIPEIGALNTSTLGMAEGCVRKRLKVLRNASSSGTHSVLLRDQFLLAFTGMEVKNSYACMLTM